MVVGGGEDREGFKLLYRDHLVYYRLTCFETKINGRQYVTLAIHSADARKTNNDVTVTFCQVRNYRESSFLV